MNSPARRRGVSAAEKTGSAAMEAELCMCSDRTATAMKAVPVFLSRFKSHIEVLVFISFLHLVGNLMLFSL